MNKMKNGQKSAFWIWTIIFQFTFAPLANAQSDAIYDGDSGNAEAMARQLRQQQGMQAIGSIFGTAQQAMQQMQNQQLQQAAQQQSMAMRQSLQAKPLRDDFFPGCTILQAKSNEISEKCEGTADINKGELYKTIVEVAEQNGNLYGNFALSGNTERGKTAGIDCYDQTLDNQLRPALDARVTEIDALINDLNIKNEQYLISSEKELDELKKLDAELNGEASENEGKYLADSTFGKDFGDNVCATIMGKAQFDTTGGAGGLKAIQTSLQATADEAKSTELLTKSKRYEASIRKAAKKVASKLNRLSTAKLAEQKDLPTLTGISLGIGSSTALKNAYAAGIETFQDTTAEIMGDVAGDVTDKSLQGTMFHKDSGRFDEALSDYTHRTKKTCFKKAIKSGSGGVSSLVKKLFKVNKSKKSNRESDSRFKQYVSSLLKSDHPMSTILKKIKTQEKKSGRGYAITFGKSSVVGDVQFSASKAYKVSELLSLYENVCTEEFNDLPTRQITKAREHRKRFATAKDEMLGQMQTTIIDKMINCTDDPQFGEGALSCTKEGMDPNGGDFCLSGAVKCASNMNACVSKAEDKIKTIRNQVKVKAKRFKDNTEKLKREQFTLYKSVEGMVAAQSQRLNQMFPGKTGYKIPTEVSPDIVADEETLYQTGGNIDPSLKLEDPKKYFEKMKNKLTAVKDAIVAQNEQVIAEVEAHKAKILTNHENERDRWKELAKRCSGKIDEANANAMKAYNEQMGEIRKKQEADTIACNNVEAFLANPSCDDVEGIGSDAMHIASLMGDQQALQAINEFGRNCRKFGNHDNGDASAYANVSENGGPQDLLSYCKSDGVKNSSCVKYVEYFGLYEGTADDPATCNYAGESDEDLEKDFVSSYENNYCKIDGGELKFKPATNPKADYSLEKCKNSSKLKEKMEKTRDYKDLVKATKNAEDALKKANEAETPDPKVVKAAEEEVDAAEKAEDEYLDQDPIKFATGKYVCSSSEIADGTDVSIKKEYEDSLTAEGFQPCVNKVSDTSTPNSKYLRAYKKDIYADTNRSLLTDQSQAHKCAKTPEDAEEKYAEAYQEALNIQNQDAINSLASDLSQVTTRACNAQNNQEMSMKTMFDGMGSGMNPMQMMNSGAIPN